MGENGKVKEKMPKNLDVLISEKLKIVRNEFQDLCDTLEKLGITLKRDCQTSDSNVLLNSDESTDEKNKVTTEAPNLLQVPAMTCSSSKTSGNTIDSEVLSSCGCNEAETSISVIKCLDNGSDASTSDTDFNELFDCCSDTSTTAVKLSNTDSDSSSSSWENLEIDSEVSSTTMTLTKNRKMFRNVENYTYGDFMDRFSEACTNIVKYNHDNTDVNATSVPPDQAWEGLQLEILSSNNPQKTFDGFLSCHSTDPCRALESIDSDSKSSHSGLKILNSDQESYTGKRCNNVNESTSIDKEAIITAEKSFYADLALANDRMTSVIADEEWEKAMFLTDEEIEINRLIYSGMPLYDPVEDLHDPVKALHDPGKARNDFFEKINQTQYEYSKPSDGDSESYHSTLQFSDSDAESCSSDLQFSHKKQENILNMIELRNALNSIVETRVFDQGSAITAENSFYDDFGSNNNRRPTVSPIETKVRKEGSVALTITDDEWNRLSLGEKHDRDLHRTLDEFLSSSNQNQYETFKSSDSNSEFCHSSDWKLSESDEESDSDKKSRNILKMLKAMQRLIINKNLSPSKYNAAFKIMGHQKAAIAAEETSHRNDDNRGPPVSSDKTMDGHPDTLANIFKTIVKFHPIKKFEIPPYASANAKRTLGITGRKMDGSCMKHTENNMPLYDIHENRNILKECFTNIDSHSVMVFEIGDCFSQNSSIICDDLIKEYLNTAVKVNIFLIKKVKDVSNEDYESRMSTLDCLDDELGFLSAILITTRNDWVKQFCEIKQNLRNISQSITSSRGLYYMGILRVCMKLAGLLLKFCIEKQLELENYEKDLILHHKCNH